MRLIDCRILIAATWRRHQQSGRLLPAGKARPQRPTGAARGPGVVAPLTAVIAAICIAVGTVAAFASVPRATPIHVKLSSRKWNAVSLPGLPLGIADHNGVLWVCGGGEMLARSDDHGHTWKVVHFTKGGELLFSLTFFGDDGWALGSQSVEYRTTDDGTHWERMPGSGGDVTRVLAADSSHLIAQTPYGILSSSDGGVHWRSHAVRSPPPGNRLDRVEAIAIPGALRAGALMESPEKKRATMWPRQLFLSTRDSGRSWKAIAFPGTMYLANVYSSHGGYEAFGTMEVNHGIGSVLFRSADGVKWTTSPARRVCGCNCRQQGCLTVGRAGWVDRRGARPVYWKVNSLPWLAREWAAAGNVMCMVSAKLECIEAKPAGKPKPARAPARPAMPSVIHVASRLLVQQCIRCTPPMYPEMDRSNRVRGPVVMKVIVGRNGGVQSVALVSAPSAGLAQAAMTAVSGWHYSLTLLNGNPVEVVSSITVNFTLAR